LVVVVNLQFTLSNLKFKKKKKEKERRKVNVMTKPQVIICSRSKETFVCIIFVLLHELYPCPEQRETDLILSNLY